jgi:hypothetical protein
MKDFELRKILTNRASYCCHDPTATTCDEFPPEIFFPVPGHCSNRMAEAKTWRPRGPKARCQDVIPIN